jgi:hypothetical protein
MLNPLLTTVSQGWRGQGVVWLLNPFRNPLFCRDEPANEFVEVTPMPGSGAVAQVAVGQDVYVLDTRRKIFKYNGEGEARNPSQSKQCIVDQQGEGAARILSRFLTSRVLEACPTGHDPRKRAHERH